MTKARMITRITGQGSAISRDRAAFLRGLPFARAARARKALNLASPPGTLDHEDGKPLDNPAGRFPAGIAGRPGNACLAAILRVRATGKIFHVTQYPDRGHASLRMAGNPLGEKCATWPLRPLIPPRRAPMAVIRSVRPRLVGVPPVIEQQPLEQSARSRLDGDAPLRQDAALRRSHVGDPSDGPAPRHVELPARSPVAPGRDCPPARRRESARRGARSGPPRPSPLRRTASASPGSLD
jgi:hypothetical protein